jgi:hypothetical protein
LPSRKSFLAAAASVPLLAAAPPREKPPSALAQAFAQRMRAFDPRLSAEDLDAIARGIDGNLGIGKAVNPKGEALQNWDEPATTFGVPSP